jgi:hypothetical protein
MTTLTDEQCDLLISPAIWNLEEPTGTLLIMLRGMTRAAYAAGAAAAQVPREPTWDMTIAGMARDGPEETWRAMYDVWERDAAQPAAQDQCESSR